MTAAKLANYRIKGTTADIDTCDHCGRTDLRKTVILATLDNDGNELDIRHFGVDCAARATRTRQSAVRAAADAADHHIAQAKMWAVKALPVFERMSVTEYIAANPVLADRPASEAAARLAATVAEARKILSGDITGTRFDY